MNRPNILWICTDQQRYDTLGCYGNASIATPNLDRLAETGVLFEHAFCQSTVCTPSRASFLTGRYPRTTRCRQNGQAIPANELLITKLLHDSGYVCGLAGKLHLSPCHPSVCKGTERRIDDGYDQFFWSHDVGAQWPTNAYVQWLEGEDVSPETRDLADSDYVRVGPATEHTQTAWCVDRAMQFIRGCAPFDRPWLFSINVFDPHHSFRIPEDMVERCRERLGEVPLPNYTEGELANKPVWQRIDHRGGYGGKGGFDFTQIGEQDQRWIRAAYWAMVEVIDQQMGRLFDFLEETEQRDNTIVILMSDHGEMLGDHGIYLKGPYFYEPMIRVPLIVSWPDGLRGDRRSPALVELVDLVPTLLEALEMPQPPGVQGRSLWPLLTGDGPPVRHREDIYCEFYGANFHYDPPAHTTMVRTERYKLSVAHGRQTGELYDLLRDPREAHNRWDDADYAAVRLEMMTRLADRMAWTADPLPVREAPW